MRDAFRPSATDCGAITCRQPTPASRAILGRISMAGGPGAEILARAVCAISEEGGDTVSRNRECPGFGERTYPSSCQVYSVRRQATVLRIDRDNMRKSGACPGGIRSLARAYNIQGAVAQLVNSTAGADGPFVRDIGLGRVRTKNGLANLMRTSAPVSLFPEPPISARLCLRVPGRKTDDPRRTRPSNAMAMSPQGNANNWRSPVVRRLITGPLSAGPIYPILNAGWHSGGECNPRKCRIPDFSCTLPLALASDLWLCVITCAGRRKLQAKLGRWDWRVA